MVPLYDYIVSDMKTTHTVVIRICAKCGIYSTLTGITSLVLIDKDDKPMVKYAVVSDSKIQVPQEMFTRISFVPTTKTTTQEVDNYWYGVVYKDLILYDDFHIPLKPNEEFDPDKMSLIMHEGTKLTYMHRLLYAGVEYPSKGYSQNWF